MVTETDEYQRAKRRVEEIKGFYVHAAVFVIVNLFLFTLNMITSPGTLWFYWPLLGWGVGFVIHAVMVFGVNGFLTDEWEEREIRRRMRRGSGDDHLRPAA